MTARVDILEDISVFDEADWDAVAGNSLFASYRWLRFWTAAQASTWPRSRCAVLAVSKGSDLIGHSSHYRYPYPLPLAQSWQRKLARGLLWPANPINHHSKPSIRPDASTDHVLTLLDEGMGRLRRRWMAPATRLVFLDGTSDAALIAKLKSLGYHLGPGITDTRLPLTAPTFDDYLARAMRSKYRNFLKRCYDRAARTGLRFEIPDHPARYQSQIYGLLKNVADRNFSESLYAPTFLEAAERHLRPGDLTVILAWLGDRPAACTVNYRDGDRFVMKSLGLDYGVAPDLNLYRLIIAEGIRHAIGSGAGVVHGGFSQFDIKRRLGFQQVETCTAVKAWPASLSRLFSYRSTAMTGSGSPRRQVEAAL